MAKTSRRPHDPMKLRDVVLEGYDRIAEHAAMTLGGSPPGAAAVAQRAGYASGELDDLEAGPDLGMGGGSPIAIDVLRPGDVVADLGCGGGMDSFLAARAVGPRGRVIGIDRADWMIEQARKNARCGRYANVEFRAACIEDLPIDDSSVDVILSNCVINSSPRKHKVYAEAYRVLRPGGRLGVSDVVLERALPDPVLHSINAYTGCVGGGSLREPYLRMIREAGFRDVRVERESCFCEAIDLADAAMDEAMATLGIERAQAMEYARAVTRLHISARK